MARTLEEGDIFFCYRPRVDVDQVRGLADVQRFFVILKPGGKPVFRRVVVGRKRLPGIEEHERTWGFVDLVTDKAEEIEDELDPVAYETRTRGRRVRPPARPAGEGVYAIVSHDGHTHLAYALELPEHPGPVQVELNINPEASLIATVRNPEAPAPPRTGMPASRRPDYPPALREKFAGRRFADLDPPDFLDHPGTELVLIGASPDVGRELGLSLHPRRETERSADIFTTLGMERTSHPVEPLLTGEWT
ncbi:hypothetical protein [Actinophytocola sp.]|jgi:hypothetical protein|uniref:hypothetical protein n=1 Tax=Actinophytocola sp. TaxID=1872138 RepID=UPI002EDB4B20